jgi:Sec-independent protein secretion pathway component TatC
VGRFSKTLIAALVAAAFSWKYRQALLQFWCAPFLRQFDQAVIDFSMLNDAAAFGMMAQVTASSALLVAFPVLCGETWLLICERAARPDARRLTLPFALTSGVVALLVLWLIRQIEFTLFYRSAQL